MAVIAMMSIIVDLGKNSRLEVSSVAGIICHRMICSGVPI
jgi:hypothetical protein